MNTTAKQNLTLILVGIITIMVAYSVWQFSEYKELQEAE